MAGTQASGLLVSRVPGPAVLRGVVATVSPQAPAVGLVAAVLWVRGGAALLEELAEVRPVPLLYCFREGFNY